MADIVDPRTRSRMMAGIKGQHTKPEMLVRRALHSAGFRFRLHDPKLPGRPDIVLPRWRAIVEINGCFWHRHEGCRFATLPSTRPQFWEAKFARNMERDRSNHSALLDAGWRLAVIWECALRNDLAKEAVEILCEWIVSDEKSLVIPEHPA